jgi:hypothetical protein
MLELNIYIIMNLQNMYKYNLYYFTEVNNT